MPTPSCPALTGATLAVLLAAAPAPLRADTVRLHVRVETRGAPGQQASRAWAFTTSDEAGTRRVEVPRLCVRVVGHQVHERCQDNASFVEVVERAEGLPGSGALCVEAQASAVWQETPLAATARACP